MRCDLHQTTRSLGQFTEEIDLSLKSALTNKENWIFAGAQMGAGVLNYAFQIWASQKLTPTEFGLWSGWFAHFSFFLFVTIWIQSLTTIQGALPVVVSTMTAWAAFAVMTAFSIFAVSSGFEDYAGWAWMLLFSTFFGLGLSHRFLLVAAAGSVTISVSKFVIAYFYPSFDGFRWAILFGPAFACLFFLAYYPKFHALASKPKPLKRPVIFSALFLAVATALIPQLDLLSAQSILTPDQLGGFAKVALLYKGIFFLLMILAQVLVTYQVKGATLKISYLNLGALYLFGVIAAFILPYFRILSYLPGFWMTGATVHIVSLSLMFFLTQQEAANQRWAWPALWTLILAAEYSLARYAGFGLLNYWIAGVAAESISIVIFLFLSQRKK